MKIATMLAGLLVAVVVSAQGAPQNEAEREVSWAVAQDYPIRGRAGGTYRGASVSFFVETIHAGMIVEPRVKGRFTVYLGWAMPPKAPSTVQDDFKVELLLGPAKPVPLRPNGRAGAGALMCFADFTNVRLSDVTGVRVSYRSDAEWLEEDDD